MATHDPEFYQAPKFSPEYDEPRPRQRGCFFYGCVIASVLAVLLIIALAVVSYIGYRFISDAVKEWTSPEPMELPHVQVSEEERKTAKERVTSFRTAIEEGKAVEPLVLTSDDLNALIEDSEFKGTVYAKVEGDKLKALVSIPLDKLDVGILRGRYLNGEAELKASLSEGVLLVTLDSFEINGKKPPDRFLQELRQQNLAKDAYKNPRNAEMIRRFESLEIKANKIILKPRVPGSRTARPAATPEAPMPPQQPPTPKSEAPEPDSAKH
jgi:hypothetical protein